MNLLRYAVVTGLLICNLQLLHSQESVMYSDTTWTFDFSGGSDSLLVAKQAQLFLDSAQGKTTTIFKALPASWDYTMASRLYEERNQWTYPTLMILGRWMKEFPVWNDYFKQQNDFDQHGSDTLLRSASSPQAGMEWRWTSQSRRENTYNDQDLLIQKLVYEGEPGNWTLTSKLEYVYDDLGNDTLTLISKWEIDAWIADTRTIREFDSEGREILRTEYSWNGADWDKTRIQIHSYDAAGRMLSEETGIWDMSQTWNMHHQEENTYDAEGRVIRKFQRGLAFEFTNGPSNIYRYQYDDSGRRIVLTDSLLNEQTGEFELVEKKYTRYGDRYFTSYAEICQGEEYEWNDSVYKESGIYEERYQTAMGDSIVKFHLVVHEISISLDGPSATCSGDTMRFTVSGAPGAEFYWGSGIGNIVPGENDSMIYLSDLNEGTGDLSVWVMDSTGCKSDTASLTLTVYDVPDSLTISCEEDDAMVCQGQTLVYSVPEQGGFAYGWLVNQGEVLSGDGTDSLTVQWTGDNPGKVLAWASNSHGCVSDTATRQVEIAICDGHREIPSSTIRIYPVPVRNHLYIETGEPCDRIELIDLQGILMLSSPNIKHGIDLNSLPEGVYVLKLYGAGDSYLGSRKLLKAD